MAPRIPPGTEIISLLSDQEEEDLTDHGLRHEIIDITLESDRSDSIVGMTSHP